MILSSLILIGGQSTRMGIPKHTLLLRQGTESYATLPLLVHLLLAHHEFQLTVNGPTSQIWISARDAAQRAAVVKLLTMYELPSGMDVRYILDKYLDFGPAAGLLSAYAENSTSMWLTSACDHPLISFEVLKELYVSHVHTSAAVTCFENHQGFAEPLLAIWTPSALEFLTQEAVVAQTEGQKLGPSQVIRKLQGLAAEGRKISRNQNCSQPVNLVRPADFACLINLNTPEDWTKFDGAAPNTTTIKED